MQQLCPFRQRDNGCAIIGKQDDELIWFHKAGSNPGSISSTFLRAAFTCTDPKSAKVA